MKTDHEDRREVTAAMAEAADPTGRALSAARRCVVLAKHVPTTAVSVCVALVLCSGVVTALVLPAASDSTSVLRHPTAVTVIPPGGSAATARDGQVLNPGDVVTVGQGGRGEITTGQRLLWLGSGTQVRVDGPASTEIRRGSVVAQDPGKPWALQADQVTVSGLTGSVRIDYGYTTRVADYGGRARLDVPTGASASLSGLDQVVASGSILPGSIYPLKLDDDALDMIAAPALVALDRGLIALAGQVDADPIVLANYRSATENPSERLLPLAIAAAGAGGTEAQRAQVAVTARGQQGSWGVIAQGVNASLVGVRGDLSTLLDASPTQAAALVAAAAQTAPIVSATPGSRPGTKATPAAVPSTSGAPSPLSASPSAAPSGSVPGVTLAPVPGVTPSLPVSIGVTARPSAAPSVTPSASPTPLLNVLLDAVGGLLPSPNPVPTGGGLLGTGLLGGTTASPTPAAPGADEVTKPSPTPLVKAVLKTVGGL